AHAHPTQALLDLFTIRKHKGDFKNLSVAIVGDIFHSRVARSQVAGLEAMGVKELRLVAPENLMPQEALGKTTRRFHDVQQGITGVDVIITLRLQHERMTAQAVQPEHYF